MPEHDEAYLRRRERSVQALKAVHAIRWASGELVSSYQRPDDDDALRASYDRQAAERPGWSERHDQWLDAHPTPESWLVEEMMTPLEWMLEAEAWRPDDDD